MSNFFRRGPLLTFAALAALVTAPAELHAQRMRMGAMPSRQAPGNIAMMRGSSTMNPYMMNTYMMMSPYGNSSMSGNSSGSGSAPMSPDTGGASGGYGGQGSGGMASRQPETDQPAPLAAATLFGLPAKNGRVHWPLGLRILAPASETRVLREQLELVLYFVATQAGEGQVNHAFIDEGVEAVHELRHLLRPCEGAMADMTYTDAMRFLARAERGLVKIQMIGTSSGGASPAYSQGDPYQWNPYQGNPYLSSQ